MLNIKRYILFCILSVEHRKHVVFGSEAEETENTDYETSIMPEVAVNEKEDEFKKVFIVKRPHWISQSYDAEVVGNLSGASSRRLCNQSVWIYNEFGCVTKSTKCNVHLCTEESGKI